MARKGNRFVPVKDAQQGRLSARARELFALALCGGSLYLLLCLATFRIEDINGVIPRGGGINLGGSVGYFIASGFVYVLGFASFVPFLGLLAYSIALFVGKEIERQIVKALGALVFAAMLSLLLAGFDKQGVTTMSPQGPAARSAPICIRGCKWRLVGRVDCCWSALVPWCPSSLPRNGCFPQPC